MMGTGNSLQIFGQGEQYNQASRGGAMIVRGAGPGFYKRGNELAFVARALISQEGQARLLHGAAGPRLAAEWNMPGQFAQQIRAIFGRPPGSRRWPVSCCPRAAQDHEIFIGF
jgi:hypothetical protein